jgi:hypothetical protein
VFARVLSEQVVVAENAVCRAPAHAQSEQVHQAASAETGGFFRAATTVCSTSGGVRAGWWWGRREWFWKASSPACQRRSHSRTVLRAQPNWRMAARMPWVVAWRTSSWRRE